jgi:hypothetical protein
MVSLLVQQELQENLRQSRRDGSYIHPLDFKNGAEGEPRTSAAAQSQTYRRVKDKVM